MARITRSTTRQAQARAAHPAAATAASSTPSVVTVFNESSISHVMISVQSLKVGSSRGGSASSDYPANVPLEPNTAPHFLSIQVGQGVAIKGHAVLEKVEKWGQVYRGLHVRPGDEFTVIDDPTNPPLSRDELVIGKQLLQTAIEQNNYSDKTTWTAVAKRIGRRPDSIIELYQFANFRIIWQETYHPPKVVKNLPVGLLVSLIKSNEFTMEVYWRALDRYPGGNADMITAKYDFQGTGSSLPGPNTNPTVTATVYTNWDGTHSLAGTFLPKSLEKFSFENVRSKLLDFLSNSVEDGDNNLNVTCHLEDSITQDSEEYNTEWSSQEVLVYVRGLPWRLNTMQAFSLADRTLFHILCLVNLRVGRRRQARLPMDALCRVMEFAVSEYANGQNASKGALIARLHREAVQTNLRWRAVDEVLPVLMKPTSTQLGLLDTLGTLVGIGRPVQFGGDVDYVEDLEDTKQSVAGKDCEGNRVEFDFNESRLYVHPVYLENYRVQQ